MPRRLPADGLSEPLRRAVRRALGSLSLNELERRTGVQRESVTRFLRGERSLVLDRAGRLATYLGLTFTPTPKPRRRGRKGG